MTDPKNKDIFGQDKLKQDLLNASLLNKALTDPFKLSQKKSQLAYDLLKKDEKELPDPMKDLLPPMLPDKKQIRDSLKAPKLLSLNQNKPPYSLNQDQAESSKTKDLDYLKQKYRPIKDSGPVSGYKIPSQFQSLRNKLKTQKSPNLSPESKEDVEWLDYRPLDDDSSKINPNFSMGRHNQEKKPVQVKDPSLLYKLPQVFGGLSNKNTKTDDDLKLKSGVDKKEPVQENVNLEKNDSSKDILDHYSSYKENFNKVLQGKQYLKMGHETEQVSLLQDLLKQEGYELDDETGIYGESTLKAIKDFQSKNKEKEDGVVGPKTIQALLKSRLRQEEPVYSQFLIFKPGAGYSQSRVKSYSNYNRPIDKENREIYGNSRRWGDASLKTQKKVINTIIEQGKKKGLSSREIAHVLAITNIESGFNPDAAAGTTSASGLGQFVNKTAAPYIFNKKYKDLTKEEKLELDKKRFDVNIGSSILIDHYLDNKKLAKKRGFKGEDLETMVYKYHHDGPTKDYGGYKLSQKKVIPLLDKYEALLKELENSESSETESE